VNDDLAHKDAESLLEVSEKMKSFVFTRGDYNKKDGVARWKRTPMTYHNPVLWAVLEFFLPQSVAIINWQ